MGEKRDETTTARAERDWQCYPGCCDEIIRCATTPGTMGKAYAKGYNDGVLAEDDGDCHEGALTPLGDPCEYGCDSVCVSLTHWRWRAEYFLEVSNNALTALRDIERENAARTHALPRWFKNVAVCRWTRDKARAALALSSHPTTEERR